MAILPETGRGTSQAGGGVSPSEPGSLGTTPPSSLRTAAAPPREGKVALAAITGAHGVRGEVRLKLFGESLDSLSVHRKVFVGNREMSLQRVGGTATNATARLSGIDDRSAAEALRGQLIEVERSALPPLGEGEYYHADLIGLACRDSAGQPQGIVVAVENHGAGDLLEIERPDGRRSLIPYRSGIADLVEGSILIDPAFLA